MHIVLYYRYLELNINDIDFAFENSFDRTRGLFYNKVLFHFFEIKDKN